MTNKESLTLIQALQDAKGYIDIAPLAGLAATRRRVTKQLVEALVIVRKDFIEDRVSDERATRTTRT